MRLGNAAELHGKQHVDCHDRCVGGDGDKSASPASGSAVLAGQTITYTVTATVTGGATTQPVVLTDTLSTGLTFGTVSAPGAFVAVLPAGGGVVVTMQCTVTASGLP
ncbi:isopeptide-forming domain-containing fimbrial protein [Variovorax sp. LjRoot130]|uniref:DUF7927 domain-containing protein n=1 Tax=Variovorax sp. LjRoot130 TaxID=3342261 RepID=UPI003ECC362A